MKPLIEGGVQNSPMMHKQLEKLKKIDINSCYENTKLFYRSTEAKNDYFKENIYYHYAGVSDIYLKVQEPGAVGFEIREFPAPLKIGETTDWIIIHVSRAPFYGDFVLKPYCKTEKKLEFEFEDGQDFYQLNSLGNIDNIDEPNDKAISNIEPFSFKMKIKASVDLKCYGHYPYKILDGHFFVCLYHLQSKHL